MENTFDKILKAGERKGYFRVLNDGAKIEYLPSGLKRNLDTPEEKVRAEYYFDLIEKYKYPASRIFLNVEVPAPSVGQYTDIVVYEKDDKQKPYIVVECKKEEISDTEYLQAQKQAIAYARVLKAPYAICVAGKNTHAAIETDKWDNEKPQKARISDIPVSYGEVEEFRFKKGGDVWDLKPVEQSSLKSIFQRCHNTLWKGGQRAATQAFDEFSKIIFVKMRDEKKPRKIGSYYDFQIKTHEKAESVHKRINDLYFEAKKIDPEVFKDKIDVEPEELYTVVEYLQEISLNKTNLDTKGVAFEQFMEKFFKGEFGAFFTPREIVNFAVRMMGVKNNELVLDPACGSGGFLLHALDEIRKQDDEYYPQDETKEETADHRSYWHDFAQNNLFGIEINDSIARVAKMNMIIHDDGHTNVIGGFDALDDIQKLDRKNHGFAKNRFDVIVTNPPFGAKKLFRENQYLSTYKLAEKLNGQIMNQQNTEILFIERCIDFLKSGTGQMAIVLPDGILSNSTLQYVRDFLMERAQILAVISLPQFTFTHFGAGVKSSLVFVRKKGEKEKLGRYKIFMAIAEHIGYDATGKKDAKNDLNEIYEEYKKFKK